MLAVMKEGGLTPVKGLIYEVKDGIYSSYLYVQREDGTEFQVDARTTDVISLALRKKFPLYVYEDILEKEQLRNISPDGSTYTVSVNTIDLESLKKAMAEAVEQEDYERASQLRDEIRKREGKGKNTNQP